MPKGSARRDPVTWLFAALALGAYFVISLYRLLTLTPSAVDLGTFTEFERQVAHFRAPVTDLVAPGMNIEGDHFQVAIGVIAPFFRLFPSPATLLFFQALFAAVSVFPVVTAATALSGRGSGRLIGFAYVFSWGLQQLVDFDFHEVALTVPLLAFSVSALVRRRPNLDLVAPLAARAETFWIGNPGNPVTQYIVFDGDDGGYAPPITNVPQFIAASFGKDGYVPVFTRDDVYVYRRG